MSPFDYLFSTIGKCFRMSRYTGDAEDYSSGQSIVNENMGVIPPHHRTFGGELCP